MPLCHFATLPLPFRHPLDLDRLTFDDPRVFELFQRGDTTGVFQFESGGMRRLLVEMRPDRLEDLIAANALFRPGPMDLIPDYNRRKHGTEPVPSIHPIVDRFTAETYGVMVYQEQVMQIVHELGGIPLRAAYSLIKAISKKKEKEIAKVRPVFIEGAGRQGLNRQGAEELFELILKFAGYGFNKSHSTGYAIVAYQTAYLKTYFPNQYMAAFLTYESAASKVSDWIPYLDDCKRTRFTSGRVGVEVRPPDINLSKSDFTVVFDGAEPRDAHHGHVRFGLKAIKGAGEKAIEAIITERDGDQVSRCQGAEVSSRSADPRALDTFTPRHLDTSRPYTSLFDFCERVMARGAGAINKATVESLVKCGAFDSVHGKQARASMVAAIEQAMSAAQKAAADRAGGQSQLFGFGEPPPGGTVNGAAAGSTPLKSVPPWPEADALQHEKDTLGFYVSSHPLESWKPWTGVFCSATCASIKEAKQDQRVVVAAIAQSVRTLVSKTGKAAGRKMAIVTLEDLGGTADAVVFPGVYEQYGHLLTGDAPKFVLGRVDHSRGDPQIIVDRLVPIDGVPLEKGRLRFVVREPRLNGTSAAAMAELRRLIQQHVPVPPGDVAATAAPPVPFDLIIETDRAWYELRPEGAGTTVGLDPDLARGVARVLGEGSARLVGGVAVEVSVSRKPSGGAHGWSR